MNKIKKLLFLSFIVSLAYCPAGASNDAGAFLRTGVGARALAMGGSQLTSGFDAVAGFWNPAKLGRFTGMALDTMYGNKFDLDLTYGFVGFASELKAGRNNIGALNIIIIRQGISDIPKSTRLDINSRPIIDGTFKNIDQALYLSYGKKVLPVLHAGLSVKYISQVIDGKKGTGSGMDAGIFLSADRFPVSAGIVYQNLGQTAIEWQSGYKDAISPNLRAGIGAEIPVSRFFIDRITIELSSDKRKNRDTFYSQGLEINLQNFFCARFGHTRNNLSFGGGIFYKIIRLDYSFNLHDIGDTHWFGIGADF